MIAQPNTIGPRILTSSWSTKLPADHIQIGISRGQPRGPGGGYRMFRALAPGDWFKTVDAEVYKKRFFAETLAPLDPVSVAARIVELSRGKVPVLCCYEHPDKDDQWCHRGYVSAWFADGMGLPVYEFGREDRGSGWAHPKIPAAHRHAPEGDCPTTLL